MRAPHAFPKRISVEPTNYCNQRCTLCPRQGFSRPLGFMEPELFQRIARECAAHDTALWLHFLGEPLLHRELLDLVRYAKGAGVRQVGLSTNGVVLSGAWVDGLLDSGLDRLECSMDADDRESYRAMRGRDHFDRVIRNVRGFLDRKRERGLRRPVTSIQFVRTEAVEARLEELVEGWRPHLGPDDFVMTIAPTPFGGHVDAEPPPGAAAARAPRRPPCTWLFSSLVVLQDGTVTMCGADWDAHAPLGHLRDSSIEEIWTGALMERRRQIHRDGRFEEISPCASCEDWKWADGEGYVNALDEVNERLRQRASARRSAAGAGGRSAPRG